jgi:hypothetical protein
MCVCACEHACVHAHTYKHTRDARVSESKGHENTRARTARARTHKHTHSHTLTHTHLHTHTHTHTVASFIITAVLSAESMSAICFSIDVCMCRVWSTVFRVCLCVHSCVGTWMRGHVRMG